MTLVDTSVWVDHFRRGNARLRSLLEAGEVATHPMIIGELSCGSLVRRQEALHWLSLLPRVAQVPDSIVQEAIESRRLWGRGIGWIDAHILTSSLVSHTRLWTLDARLAALTLER